MTVTIRVQGLDEIVKRFGTADKIVKREVARALTFSAEDIVFSIRNYPPKPPGSSYKRTLMLAKKTVFKVYKQAMRAVIGNNVSYAPDVIGDGTQAPVHRGRWKTISQHAAAKMPRIAGYMADANRRIARALTGEG